MARAKPRLGPTFEMSYGVLESLFYDRLIAPALIELKSGLQEVFVDRVPPGARVLDVGCGGGQLALALAAERPDLRITGVDLSTQQVVRATRRARRHPAKVDFVQGSALELPFPDGCVDAVVSVASIKHWPAPGAGLVECVRVLRPGGRLLVLDAERGCRLDDARRFVRRWKIPRPLQELAVAFFVTYVAGQSLTIDDFRALSVGLGLDGVEIARERGLPALILTGLKA